MILGKRTLCEPHAGADQGEREQQPCDARRNATAIAMRLGARGLHQRERSRAGDCRRTTPLGTKPGERLRHRNVGGHRVADDDRAVGALDQVAQMRGLRGRDEHEQRTHLAKACGEPAPARMREQLFVVDRRRAARHDEQLARVGHLMRDAVQRYAEEEAVHEAVRVYLIDQRQQRRRITDQVAHRDAPMLRLEARDAQRDLRRRDRIAAHDDDGVILVQRRAEVASPLRPVERSDHGPPSYTQNDCFDSRPMRSASSRVAYGPITTR